MEIFGRGDPLRFVEEEGLLKDDAADRIIPARIGGRSAITLDSSAHLLQRARTVLFTKCVPRQTRQKKRRMCEEAPTNDEIVRRVELKEKRLTDAERSKEPRPSRLPEVDLLEVWKRPEKSIPVAVSDADPEFQSSSSSVLPALET